jgi:alanine racemase
MGIESRIMLLKTVPKGTSVSYGCTFTTKRKSRLAIVPIGYADGYPWSASGKAHVLVHGKRVPIAGRVTMDMIVLDVTDVEGVSVGDDVVLLGPQKDATITVGELAKWAGTIPYEILCRVSKRMPRIYIGEKGIGNT